MFLRLGVYTTEHVIVVHFTLFIIFLTRDAILVKKKRKKEKPELFLDKLLITVRSF